MQPITDYSKFFNDAKDALNRLDAISAQLESEKSREKELRGVLLTEQKKRDEKIASTLKNRSDELSAVYDKESAGVTEKIKQVKANRDKAKATGVRERISREIAGIEENNKEIFLQLKERTRQGGAPKFCSTRLYNALFMPRRFWEVLLLLSLFVLFFVLIPLAIYLRISDSQRGYLYLILIYVVAILLFGGFYLLVNNRTKSKYGAVLRENRRLMDQYYENNKEIKRVARSIRKDKSETSYDLGAFDAELLNLERELAGLAQQKKQALEAFESTTKPALIADIRRDFDPRIETVQKEYEEVLTSLRMSESQKKNLVLFIGDEYESYLGRKYLNIETINALQNIMETENIQTLSEAKESLKAKGIK